MFLPEKMKRVKMIFLQENKDGLLSVLQENGIIQITPFKDVIREYPEGVETCEVNTEEVEKINVLISSVNKILDEVGRGESLTGQLLSAKKEKQLTLEKDYTLKECQKILENTQQKLEEMKETPEGERPKYKKIKDNMRLKLKTVLEILEMRLSRLKTEGLLGKTKKTYLLDGWIPEKYVNILKNIVRKNTENAIIEFSKPKREEKVPVKLKDSIAKPFQLFTKMYGMPKHGELDPTPILAITFPLIFGIMFADGFDGLMLMAIGFLFRSRGGKRSQGLKDLGSIIMIMGLSATLFGIAMGEFMGGLVHIKPILFSPLENPLKVLSFALLIGVAHISLGIILGIINSLLKKDYIEALFSHAAWFLVLISIGLIYLNGFSFLYLGLIILGIALVSIKEGVIKGPLELTRLGSNFVSYSRILALNMAHTGVNSVFTLMLGGFTSTPVGFAISFVILAVIHLILIFLAFFSAFAHTLRLHFLEFFSKFHVETAQEFKPFYAKRRYTIVRS